MKLLTIEAVQSILDERPAWKHSSGKLSREWSFLTFPEAIAFVDQVALLAEQANHHPDIDIRYTRVCLTLISHDAGGLTNRDISMLRRLDDAFPATKRKENSMR